jgi:hypothetical protein
MMFGSVGENAKENISSGASRSNYQLNENLNKMILKLI